MNGAMRPKDRQEGQAALDILQKVIVDEFL